MTGGTRFLLLGLPRERLAVDCEADRDEELFSLAAGVMRAGWEEAGGGGGAGGAATAGKTACA